MDDIAFATIRFRIYAILCLFLSILSISLVASTWSSECELPRRAIACMQRAYVVREQTSESAACQSKSNRKVERHTCDAISKPNQTLPSSHEKVQFISGQTWFLGASITSPAPTNWSTGAPLSRDACPSWHSIKVRER